jgi:hypothetical protein
MAVKKVKRARAKSSTTKKASSRAGTKSKTRAKGLIGRAKKAVKEVAKGAAAGAMTGAVETTRKLADLPEESTTRSKAKPQKK